MHSMLKERLTGGNKPRVIASFVEVKKVYDIQVNSQI